MSAPPSVIALDGPAGSGKSTVAAILAQRLDWLYFDTGAMYRALTHLALMQGLELADGAVLGALAQQTEIEIEPPTADEDDGRQYTVCVGDEDITWQIRRPSVDAHVSQVSAHPSVRDALKAQQRRIGLRGKVIMVGRDIGTVVMPDAPLKIYLDASVEERAHRRYSEVINRGETADYETILAALKQRDEYDSTRAAAPLRPAADAEQIMTDGLPINTVVTLILEKVRQNQFLSA